MKDRDSAKNSFIPTLLKISNFKMLLQRSFQCLTQVNKQNESDKIKRCASGDHGENLLASYGDKTDVVMRPLAFVPTVVINEVSMMKLI